MKKTYVFTTLLLVLLLASCDKTVTFDNQWQTDQEAQFEKIAANTAEYKKIESQSGNGFIMYKELESGSGESPYFTDKVRVLYTGYFKRFWDREDRFTGDDGNIFINKVIFDSTANRNDIPSTFEVKNMVDGFATALQHMKEGDKWEIWIPWKLGYGATSSAQSQIPAHTTLVFELELVEVM